MHSPDDTPSQLGDFRIEREIGRGGMGVVYEAEQISLKRRVALKVLRFGGGADAEAIQRFQREAETVAGLEHANIVPVYAVGTEDGVRRVLIFFDLKDPTDIPAVTEPFFQNANASVDLFPVMNMEDMQTGMAKLH